ncbi:MAG: PrsW family glutamic-type intramembrane protease [Patescibacteria group bacterium]
MFDLEFIKTINQVIYHVIFFGAIFIPPLFWLWYFRFYDYRHPEPLKLLIKVFLMGFSSCFVLRALSYFFEIPTIYTYISVSWLSSLDKIIIFVAVLAFLEELVKFLILRFYVYHQKDFDEPIDGVIYGITVGLGFATCENVMHIISQGPEVVVSRFATATLLHALLGGLMGAFLSQEKFSFFKKCCIAIRALVLCTFLHFVYNIFVLYDLTGFNIKGETFWVAGIFVILLIVIVRLKKKYLCQPTKKLKTS